MLLFGGYIEFLLSSFIAIVKPSKKYTFGEVRYSGELISYYTSVVAFPLIIIVSLVWAIWIIFKPKEVLDKDEYIEKYSILYFDKLYTTKLHRMSTLMFILRRMFIIWLIVGFNNIGEGIKVTLFMLQNLLFGLYVIRFQQMSTREQ